MLCYVMLFTDNDRTTGRSWRSWLYGNMGRRGVGKGQGEMGREGQGERGSGTGIEDRERAGRARLGVPSS